MTTHFIPCHVGASDKVWPRKAKRPSCGSFCRVGDTQQGMGNTQTFLPQVWEGGLAGQLVWILESVDLCGYLCGFGQVAFNL